VPELTPIPSAQRPADPGYQPISGYAVAAGLIAAAFAVVAVVLLVQAVFSGRTAMWEELLALPVVGIILAAIARSHIRNAEGTRTGLKLATTAWWVCVLGGVAYFAYIQANTFALKRESGRAADRFFDKLKAGKVTHAFVDLLPPEERGRENPDNVEAFETAYAPGGYMLFKSHDLVRVVVRNGSAVEVERTGVKDFGQEGNGFRATHLYRLTCPEGVFEVQVKLIAAETKKTRQPQWYIPATPAPNISIRPERISEYGRLVVELEQEAEAYSRLWMGHLTSGRVAWAHLLTLPPGQRPVPESAVTPAAMLAGGPAASVPLRREILPPERASQRPAEAPGSLAAQARLGFDDLAAAGFFRLDAAGTALPAEKLTRLRDVWTPPRILPSAANRAPQQSGIATPEATETMITADAVTWVGSADVVLDAPGQFIRGRLAVVSTNPDLLAKLAAARDKGALEDDPAVTLKSLPARDWRIAWYQTNAETQSMIQGPGGPRGP